MKGCLLCIVCFILLIKGFFLCRRYQLRPLIVTRARLEGMVVDKETKKPISYALLKTWWMPYAKFGPEKNDYGRFHAIGYKVLVTDKDGKFVIPEERLKAESGSKCWSSEGFCGRIRAQGIAGKFIEVWFPGYKKKELRAEWEKQFPAHLTLEMEKPKTAEDAVNILYNGIDDLPIFKQNFPQEKAKYLYSLYRTQCSSFGQQLIDKSPEYIDKLFIIGCYDIKKIKCENIKTQSFRERCETYKREYAK